jgi:DNA-binding GntR family transcriptional regulator
MTAAMLPIVHRKKAELVYEHLREQIVNGTYPPGHRMLLAEVSASLGLSQMPVREALLRLEQDGLLESEPHKSMRVSAVSLADAADLFEVRCELEGLAAARAAAAGDPTLVRDLTTLNAAFARALAQGPDYPAMGAANWAFHRRILETAGNGQLARMLEDVWTRSLRYRLGYQRIPGRARRTIAEHEAIIEGLGRADAGAAREAARAHIRQAGHELARTIAREGMEVSPPAGASRDGVRGTDDGPPRSASRRPTKRSHGS